MPWIQIKLNATNENAEQIGDMLMEETGALSVTFLDAQDTPVFEPLPGEKLAYGAILTFWHCTMQKLIQTSSSLKSKQAACLLTILLTK